MADDRKVELNYSNFGAVPLPRPIDSTAASHPAAEVAGRLSYSLGLQLQYQQQLTALQSTMSAAAAHEASRSTQKASRPSTVSPPPAFPAAHAAPPPLEAPSNLYSQSASLYNQLQEQASYLLPEWWLPALNSAEPVGISTPNQALPQEALGRAGQGPYIMGAHGGNIDCCAMLAQQPMMYAAEQERQQPLLAAQMRAIAAGIGVTQAEVGPGPSPPFRGPAVGFGRAPFQYDGETYIPLTPTRHEPMHSCLHKVQHSQYLQGHCTYWAGHHRFSRTPHLQVTCKCSCVGIDSVTDDAVILCLAMYDHKSAASASFAQGLCIFLGITRVWRHACLPG